MKPSVLDIDVQIPVTCAKSGLNFILHVTQMEYIPDSPATGPSYSCGGEPPEAAEAYATEGYVELDGDVFDIKDITSEDMDVIMSLTNDNQALFDVLCDENDELVYECLLKKAEDDAPCWEDAVPVFSHVASILD